MRKYENVDIVAALGAVVELNTAHYKSDFKYDIEMFKEAAKNPDGENNRFLWLSRPSGTHCYHEREVYIKDTAANNYWSGFASVLGKEPFQNIIVNDRVLAFAVEVKGMENGRVKGDICEVDYRAHIKHLNKTALPLHTVTAVYKDGTTLTLPHKEHDAKRERLYHQHGQLQTLTPHPQDTAALRDILSHAQEQRENNARPAAFKVRVKNPAQSGNHKQADAKQSHAKQDNAQPSIKQQIEAGKKQLAAERAAAPQRAAVKSINTGLGD